MIARRLAYADPPYPGQESRYSGRGVVNLPLLVAHLREFDGWALSTSASALLEVWQLCPEARCAAWMKTWSVNGWSRVRWTWEPVLFVTDRRGLHPGDRSTASDDLVAAPSCGPNSWGEQPGKGGGSKPRAFLEWLLDDLLEREPGDEICDLFPGSGGLARLNTRQPELLEMEALCRS